MARTDFRSVDEYIASHPEPVQKVLQRVRGAIRKALPDAEERISYQIAAFELHGGIVLYFAGWKEHYSLYPVGEPLVAAFADELAPYALSKGTIRFPLAAPVPVQLIGRIARFRAKETLARQEAKQAKKPAKKPAKRRPRSKAGSG